MPAIVSESEVRGQLDGIGIARQRLFADRQIVLDRITLRPGSTFQFDVRARGLIWFHMIDGEAALKTPYSEERLLIYHSLTLPPGLKATLSPMPDKSASFLQLEIRDLGELDPAFSTDPPRLMMIDWPREPVYETQHDHRMRVQLVAPHICNTAAFRIDMVVYPAGSAGPASHREGGATFIFVIGGRGAARMGDQRLALQEGSQLHVAEREQYAIEAAKDADLGFLQILVPGNSRTVWADQRNASVWVETGRNMYNDRPAREGRPGGFTGWGLG